MNLGYKQGRPQLENLVLFCLLCLLLTIPLAASAQQRIYINPSVIQPDSDGIIRFTVDAEGIPDPGFGLYALSIKFLDSGNFKFADDASFGMVGPTISDSTKVTCSVALSTTSGATDQLIFGQRALGSGQGQLVLDSKTANGEISCPETLNGPVSADTVLHLCGLQGRNVDPQTGNGSLIEYVCFAGANVPNGVINIEPRLYPNETGAIFPFEEGDAVIDKFEPGKIVIGSSNTAPSITSTPVTEATQGQPYSYDVEATDPDAGDTLTFSLVTAPVGMTIDPASGLIGWTPSNAQVGDNAVEVQVTDSGGLSDTQSFTVTVDDVNEAPSITSTPVLGATQGQPYSYDVEATDPDAGDTLTFNLVTSPAGMTIDPASGLISWTPSNAQVGDNAVEVQVTDSGGLSDTQSFTVTVDDVNEAPVADPGPDQSVFVGDMVTLDGSGSSDVDGDVLSFFWSLTPPSGSSATLSDATLVNPTFEVDLPGTYVAQLIVNDSEVDSAPATVTIVAVEAEELGYIDETSYRLISTRRASYPYYNYAYDVVFVNTSGFDIDNLVLQLTSTEPDPMILEGTVKFGFVPAGGSARSQNSFVLQHNRRLPLNLSLLNWEIE